MKPLFTFLILTFLCAITPAVAQNILPAPELNPKWAFCPRSLDVSFDTLMYQFAGQVNLCDTIWQEVEEIVPGKSIKTRGYYTETDNGDKGFFKYQPDCEAPSYLMYDFTLELGDTIAYPLGGWYGGDTPYYYDLVLVDTSAQNELESYLFFTTSGSTFVYWTRGHGSNQHPFPILLPCLGTSASCEFDFSGCCFNLDTLPQNTVPYNTCPLQLNRFYVDQDAITGDQTGEDWENAFIDLQDALAIASWGDEIWIAEGLYKPTESSDRTATFSIPRGVRVYGGFEGVESYRNERDAVNHMTILSGEIGDTEINEDNSYHVLYFIASDTTTLLDGFTIEKGMANNTSSLESQSGGGVLVNTSNAHPLCEPRIQHCIFRFNTARYGGGLACSGDSDRTAYPRLRDCRFEKNEATLSGGGLYFRQQGYAGVPPLLLDDCSFMDNDAFLEGGGMFVENLSRGIALQYTTFERDSCILNGGGLAINTAGGYNRPLIIIDSCHFTKGSAIGGGGLSIINSSNLVELDTTLHLLNVIINNSTFIENTAAEEGGGIEFYTSRGASRLEMNNCTIANNTLVQNGNGGGMQLKTDSHGLGWYDIKNCHFDNNTTSPNFTISGRGGLFIEGSFFGARVVANITNSIFTNNTNAIGAVAGSMGWLRATISNCSFLNNGIQPIRSSWSVDPNLALGTRLYFYNNIVWESQADFALKSGIGGLNGISISHSLFSHLNCNTPSGEAACGEGIIIGTDPLFFAPENGDLRTASCSVVRNAGTNGVLDSLDLFTDIDGNERILEDIVDMGAYEQGSDFTTLAGFVPNDCPDENLASITLDTASVQLPLLVTWENEMETGEGLNNLFSGTYTIYITDALTCMDTFTQTIPIVPPIQISSELTDASSNVAMDGRILITEVAGGTGPYTVLWSTGDTSFVIENLLPGEYDLTITDSKGCTEIFLFQVSFLDNIGTLLDNNSTWTIAPNPLHKGESVKMIFSKFEKQVYEISLLNTLGQTVWRSSIAIENKEQSYETRLPISQAGIYQLVLQTDSGKVVAVKSLISL